MGKCKFLAECGMTNGFGLHTPCRDCGEEDCEDSGKCRWWRTCNNITDKYLVPPQKCHQDEDCSVPEGSPCFGIRDISCICKEGKCKEDAMCGMTKIGLGIHIPCRDCGEEDCEDSGQCTWRGTSCNNISSDVPPGLEKCHQDEDCSVPVGSP